MVSELQWFGLSLIAYGTGVGISFLFVERRRRILKSRGTRTAGTTISTKQWGSFDWMTTVEFTDRGGTTRRCKARGQFPNDVDVIYDPENPRRARATAARGSSHKPPSTWTVRLLTAFAFIVVFGVMILAPVVSGILLLTKVWTATP